MFTLFLLVFFTLAGFLTVVFAVFMTVTNDSCQSLEGLAIEAVTPDGSNPDAADFSPLLEFYFYNEGSLNEVILDSLGVDLNGALDKVYSKFGSLLCMYSVFCDYGFVILFITTARLLVYIL